MAKYSINVEGETRLVNEAGQITREACGWKYSGGWSVLGLVRLRPFCFIPFSQWEKKIPEIKDWHYKNGKPRYTIRDLDHGTMREWGNAVRHVEVLKCGT